jgi:hypothetical protein
MAAVAIAGPGAAQAPKSPPGKVKGGGLLTAQHVREAQAAVVVVNPARLTRSAVAAGLPIDAVWKDIKEMTGVDAKAVARAEVYVTPFPGGNVLFDVAAALRFTTPAADQYARDLLAVPPEKKAGAVAGRPWYESPRYKMGKDDYWAAFLADPATAVLASRRHMMELAPATEKVLPLAAVAEGIDFTAHEVVAIALPGVVTAKLDRLLAGQKEPRYEALKPALARVKAVVATVDLARDPFVRVEFRADSADGAAVVAEALKKLLAELKAAYPDIEKGLRADLPQGYEAAVLATADAVVNRPQVAVEKSTVVVTVARPAELAPKKKK